MFCVGVAKTELMQMEFINCFYVTVTKTPDRNRCRTMDTEAPNDLTSRRTARRTVDRFWALFKGGSIE